MRTRREVRGQRSGPPRLREAVVGALLVVVFVVRAVLDLPELGLSFLYLVPTLLASLWFGLRPGLLVGVLAAALYALDASVIDPEPFPLAAAALRLVVFCSVGGGFALLLDRQVELRAVVAQRDRQIGELRAIREALVPAEVPERPALELASCYVPAEEGVAGDFYLVAPGPNDTTVLAVGDAMGKGIEAARRASFARAALATFASFTDDPLRLLEMANHSLIERSGVSSSFVTVACVSIDPGEGRMSWALAGHPAPLRLDDGSSLGVLRPGLPLGVELDLDAERSSAALTPDWGVLLFTDGLAEARPPADGNGASTNGAELFAPHIVDALRRLGGASPRQVVRELRASAEKFSGGALPDDLCMLAVRGR